MRLRAATLGEHLGRSSGWEPFKDEGSQGLPDRIQSIMWPKLRCPKLVSTNSSRFDQSAIAIIVVAPKVRDHVFDSGRLASTLESASPVRQLTREACAQGGAAPAQGMNT